MSQKKTAIIGASPNEYRYSYRATSMLKGRGHEVIPLGKSAGEIGREKIITDWPKVIESLDTITMYVGPQNQPPIYDYILGLKPKRIIFNPGTENPELSQLANTNGIETENACTLVLLSLDSY